MTKGKMLEFEQYVRIKGSDRIQINNILSAVCVGVLSILLALSGSQLSAWTIGQLAFAIPCLVTSSLAYAKICYRPSDEYRAWDRLGWVTHSVGYIMILNAMGIMLYRSDYPAISWGFIALTIILFVAYSTLDVIARKSRLKEKGLKLGFYLLSLFLGSVLPLLTGLV